MIDSDRTNAWVRRSALVAWLLLIWCAGGAAHVGAAPTTLLLCLAAAFFPYAWLIRRRHETATASEWLSPRQLAGLAIVGGLPFVFAPSGLSDDLYRFLWDARVWTNGVDPYRFAPSDPALIELRDEYWQRVNHPDVPTIYPPLAQLVFGIAHYVAHAPWTLKLMALGGHLAVLLLLVRLVAVGAPTWGPLAWALNPVALSESALGGHIDVWVGLCVLGFAFALFQKRAWVAVWLAAAASGLKLVGLALAPLVAIRSRRAVLLAVSLAAIPIVPLVGAGSGSDVTGGLGQYARKWEGNTGLFAVVDWGATQLLASHEVTPGRVRFDSLRPLLERAQGTVWEPRASFLPEKKPVFDIVEFETHVVASLIARALVVAFVFGLAFVLALRRANPIRAARSVLLAVLLLAPQVHPWYLLWLLPLDIAARRHAALIWSAIILAAYAPIDGWMAVREWQEPHLLPFVQYGIVLCVVLIEGWPSKQPAEVPENALAVDEQRELSPTAV